MSLDFQRRPRDLARGLRLYRDRVSPGLFVVVSWLPGQSRNLKGCSDVQRTRVNDRGLLSTQFPNSARWAGPSTPHNPSRYHRDRPHSPRPPHWVPGGFYGEEGPHARLSRTARKGVADRGPSASLTPLPRFPLKNKTESTKARMAWTGSSRVLS